MQMNESESNLEARSEAKSKLDAKAKLISSEYNGRKVIKTLLFLLAENCLSCVGVWAWAWHRRRACYTHLHRHTYIFAM